MEAHITFIKIIRNSANQIDSITIIVKCPFCSRPHTHLTSRIDPTEQFMSHCVKGQGIGQTYLLSLK